MIGVVKYFLWNLLIVGTLFAGFVLKETEISGKIIGVYYVGACVVALVILLGSETEQVKKILSEMKSLRFYEYPLEVLFIIAVYKMGYNKITVAMVFEFFTILYLHILKIQNEKEPKDVKPEPEKET